MLVGPFLKKKQPGQSPRAVCGGLDRFKTRNSRRAFDDGFGPGAQYQLPRLHHQRAAGYRVKKTMELHGKPSIRLLIRYRPIVLPRDKKSHPDKF